MYVVSDTTARRVTKETEMPTDREVLLLVDEQKLLHTTVESATSIEQFLKWSWSKPKATIKTVKFLQSAYGAKIPPVSSLEPEWHIASKVERFSATS